MAIRSNWTASRWLEERLRVIRLAKEGGLHEEVYNFLKTVIDDADKFAEMEGHSGNVILAYADGSKQRQLIYNASEDTLSYKYGTISRPTKSPDVLYQNGKFTSFANEMVLTIANMMIATPVSMEIE